MKKGLLLVFAIWTMSQCEAKTKVDWVLVYFIPYDNDLSYLGNSILEKLKTGTSDSVAVCVLADFDDTNGVRRYWMHRKESSVEILDTETLSDKSVIRNYFNWIDTQVEAKHSAFFFLNHGGKLTDIGLDRYPTQNYTNVDVLATEVARFNSRQQSIPELIFLQVCAHGTIEIANAMMKAARYTLFSQHILGAPNSYYSTMLASLNSGSVKDGALLARSIVDADRKEMYSSYTIIHNKTLQNTVRKIAMVLKALKGDSSLINERSIISYQYFGETYWDLKSVLERLYQTGKISVIAFHTGNRALAETITYIPSPLAKEAARFGGLSLFSPWNNSFKSYPKHFFYSIKPYRQLKKNIMPDQEKLKIEEDELEFR